MIVGRIFWSKVKKLWEQAKQGGAILTQPKTYLRHAFLPSFLSWCCKIAVTGIFLAAFAIPVTFNSIMWVVRVGVSRQRRVVHAGRRRRHAGDERARARRVLRRADIDQAIDYSTAQQLITSAWNQVVALVLVVSFSAGRAASSSSRRRTPTQRLRPPT